MSNVEQSNQAEEIQAEEIQAEEIQVEQSQVEQTQVEQSQAEPAQPRRKSFVLQSSPQSNLSKQEKIDLILQLKSKIDTLISNIRDSKTVCDKYDSEIQYFQEYIGGLMKK